MKRASRPETPIETKPETGSSAARISMAPTSGATFFGSYATSTEDNSAAAPAKSTRYCRKRAAGDTTRPPPQLLQSGISVWSCSGVAQRLQFDCARLRLPLLVENASRDGVPRYARRPQYENDPASSTSLSYDPVAARPGPIWNTFPILPLIAYTVFRVEKNPVICVGAASTSSVLSWFPSNR